MKRSPRFRLVPRPVLASRFPAALLIAVSLFFAARATAFSQTATPSAAAPASPSNNAAPEAAKNAKEDSEARQVEALRHSGAVQAIARWLHVDVETAAKIFEDLNSGILIAVILIFLARVLPKAFRARTAAIQQQLIEARTATEEANERLSAVEQRLSRLDEEIAAIVRQTEADAAQDEIRIKEALEEERQRIIQSAEQEIDAAGAAAQRHLKQFAAELAVERAAHGIRLTPEIDRLLIEDFSTNLAAEAAKGGRN